MNPDLNRPSWKPNLVLRQNIGSYTSKSQLARVSTEAWIGDNMYCPLCGCFPLGRYPANRPVADFLCPHCHGEFELKSMHRCSSKPPRIIADGTLRTMKERLRAANNPHLFVMMHWDHEVTNLTFIPNFFFSLSVIEARTPLKETARRAGWQGCNILYDAIPNIGKIPIISGGQLHSFEQIHDLVERSKMLRTERLKSRSWLLDVQRCVEMLPSDEFTLEDMYRFASYLQKKHPDNSHINEKIRQQLQFLRDRGLIEFVARCKYRKV